MKFMFVLICLSTFGHHSHYQELSVSGGGGRQDVCMCVSEREKVEYNILHGHAFKNVLGGHFLYVCV